MPTERTVTMPTAWAEDAQITIPSPPLPNTPYRDVGLTAAQIAAGQGYATLLDSSEYNEFLYRVSALLQLLEQNGILPWSQKTNYEAGAWVMGTDGVVYKATQPSGPNNGGFKAPSDIGYWDIAASAIRIATDTEASAGILETVAVNPKQLAAAGAEYAKADFSNVNVPHIVEAWRSSDGLSWYRKWSDGFIEQAGRVTSGTAQVVNLLVPFSDTNYKVFGNVVQSTDSSCFSLFARSRTTTTVTLVGFFSAGVVGVSPGMFDWYITGY